MKDLWTEPVILDGRQLRLEPLSLKHLDNLCENLINPNAWHVVHWGTKTREDFKVKIEKAIAAQEQQQGNGFAMVMKKNNEAGGISHFMHLNRPHKCLEIGGTWIGQKWQKTFVNTEAKLLMLTYAFETLGCQRVEFRVDSQNFNSQRAVQRIGAKYEGELRQSTLLPDGRKRDYKVYSILDGEWANVKGNLQWYLEKYV